MFDGLLSSNALLFTVPALIGTLVFVLKLGLMLIGGDGGDGDVDIDVDVDADLDIGADASEALESGDSTAAFTYISIQGVAALIMGFGWGGLIGMFTLEWSVLPSVAAGLGFGFFLMWLLSMLFRAIFSLQGSGNIHIRDTLGCEGSVYVNVPGAGQGMGRVRLIISERARIYRASTEGETLPTNTRVKVAKANRDNTVTVVRAN